MESAADMDKASSNTAGVGIVDATESPADSLRLSTDQIIGWGERHHAETGCWPTCSSGLVRGTPGELWHCIDMALWLGERGLPGGSSLEELFADLRCEAAICETNDGRKREPLFLEQILAWADAHHLRTGRWPTSESGPVVEAPETTWHAVDSALRKGVRGLPGGSSLPLLLAQHRGKLLPIERPALSKEQILQWVDAHYRRTGQWPGQDSGKIPESNGETWAGVDTALRNGLRGLPGGSSISTLLSNNRSVGVHRHTSRLTIEMILDWVDLYHRQTGCWPLADSGIVPSGDGSTWRSVDMALRKGARGLPGGSSLSLLLAEQRGVRRRARLPERLTIEQVLAWADAHHERTGRWPTANSGEIQHSDGSTWQGVDSALRQGVRGLPGGSSLRRLLEEHRAVPPRKRPVPLSEQRILAWADNHRCKTGRWPTVYGGPVLDNPEDTWVAVNNALRRGFRGLPGGSSLAQLLDRYRRGAESSDGAPPADFVRVDESTDEPPAEGLACTNGESQENGPGEPPDSLKKSGEKRSRRRRQTGLTIQKILAWARVYRRQNGGWPTAESGAVSTTKHITWQEIDDALRQGRDALPAGFCLERLLRGEDDRPRRLGDPLTIDRILQWTDGHYRRTGAYPTMDSGPVLDADNETWTAIDRALRRGSRGLPGGSSLSRLLNEHRR